MSKILLVFFSWFGFLLIGCNKPLHKSEDAYLADKQDYLRNIHEELVLRWPHNRTITIVCHGHSVPAGYFKTPAVKPFDSYPHLLHRSLNKKYPHAVINVIVTAIGGENCISGAERFRTDVLTHKPDVILIDYGLNDRATGLRNSEQAWSQMIQMAKEQDIKLLLMTPTVDIHTDPENADAPLHLHAEQIRTLAAKYHTGLVDSLEALSVLLRQGLTNQQLLSNGYNHPNKTSHEIVARKIMEWF